AELRDDLPLLALARPEEPGLGVARALGELHLDVVLLPGLKRDRPGVLSRGVRLRVVDEELAVHPQPDALVRLRVEGVGLRVERHDLTCPAGGEGVAVYRGVGG